MDFYMKNIDKIQQEVLRLLEMNHDVSGQTTSLRDEVLRVYQQKALSVLDDILQGSKDNITDKLENFLKKNWELVQGNLLCYTARPRDELTNLLIAIAALVTKEKNLIPIKVLMPSIGLEAGYNDYTDFDKDTHISRVLQTHVLGDNAGYLIPVKMVTEIILNDEYDNKRMANPYYDLAFINAQEMQRLRAHSVLTEAVFATKDAYDLLTSDGNHFKSSKVENNKKNANELNAKVSYETKKLDIGTTIITGTTDTTTETLGVLNRP